MNAPLKKGGIQLALPTLPGKLPKLPGMGDLPSKDDMQAQMARMKNKPQPSPFEAINAEGMTTEEAGAAEDKVIEDEFAAIREGREQQRKAIELANDSEFWFAVYFQTREQKERFLEAMDWIKHGDKYLDGRWVAKQHGVELPPRPAPYKVGRLDAKLKDLT